MSAAVNDLMVSVKSDANDTAPAANDTAPAAEDMERAVAIGEMPPAAANCNLLCLPWNLVCGYTTVNVREIQVAEYCGIVTAVRDEPGLYRQDVCGLSEKRVSTAVQVLDLPNAKVVDAGGAPVLVSAIVNYKVVDGLQALYNVENYGQFVFVNAQSVLKNIVGSRTYAELKTETASISLELARELQPVVDCAGVKIMSVALNELNYAPEIASNMLKKYVHCSTPNPTRLKRCVWSGVATDAPRRTTRSLTRSFRSLRPPSPLRSLRSRTGRPRGRCLRRASSSCRVRFRSRRTPSWRWRRGGS
jgi:hypothetical protein